MNEIANCELCQRAGTKHCQGCHLGTNFLAKTADVVNHPQHYTKGKIECIDAIEAVTDGMTGFEAYGTGTIIKYLWRWPWKNGLEDLKKARWYLEKLIAKVEQE